MAANTLGSRINTDSFSHASGSVPMYFQDSEAFSGFFPRKWEYAEFFFKNTILKNKQKYN